ncbi:sulfatase [Luteolibacter marinus]|uniref:sulfatase n=1 Tax=Luteolibacter marinus TaxID=2776705 RepID=UPI001868D3B3|nr:sulfatase [Luteolibacter marinus]
MIRALILSLALPLAAVAAPDVLLIAVDDLNDWVGCLEGHPDVKTPNIDALASRGVLFTNAHCQAPLCNPSRTSLLSGLRPGRTGIYGLAPFIRTVPEFADIELLPGYFRKHGYATGIGGKVFHTYPDPRFRPRDFDAWGPACTFGPLPPEKFVQTPSPLRLVDWGVFPARDEEQNDHAIADWAISRLKEKSVRPRLVAVGFGKPHVPCFASQQWFDLYPADSIRLPEVPPDDLDDVPPFARYLHWDLPEPRLQWLRESGEWKALVRAYLACVSYVDSEIGRVLKALDESGAADNTIVVLFSDHGWHLGEKGISGKNSLWERSTRVPLVIAGPGIRPGRCGEAVELLDLYPTLAELAGLPLPTGLDGVSLRPQLKDPSAPRERPAITTANQGNHSVRDRHWRYIRYADGSEELYDHRQDPHEWTNLAADPAHAADKARLSAWLPDHDAPPAPGSAQRILTRDHDGRWIWEGKPTEGSGSR